MPDVDRRDVDRRDVDRRDVDRRDVDVWADITCPFTHVGLLRVTEDLRALPEPVGVRVRAWPLEWVNGAPLAADAVAAKAAALTEQLGVDDFSGFRTDTWPTTTVPALALVAATYATSPARGTALSLELRRLLFHSGADVSDGEFLAQMAAAYGAPWPVPDAEAIVRAEYELGVSRGVVGSPHFFFGDDGFFCPSLDLGHDASGGLTARFDPDALAAFVARVGSGVSR